MENPAEVSDIEVRWRPLSGQDGITAASWLGDAWNILQVESPGIVGRITSGATPVALVVQTLAEAVIRKAKNPEGRKSGTIGIDDATRSWTLDPSRSTGDLSFTDEELRRLGSNRRVDPAFSVMPS